MEEGYRIIDLPNGRHRLEIFVEGKLVETYELANRQWLERYAMRYYCIARNTYGTDGFVYKLVE